MIMASPNSIPVRNKAIITARPRIPIVTSFIFSSDDLQDITDVHKTLDKEDNSQSISNGIERHRQRGRDFSHPTQIHSILDQVPANQEEGRYPEAPCKDIDDVSRLLRVPYD